MTMTDLARQLGLSKGQVSKLAAKGMPVDDLDAAKRWRHNNLDPSWAKSERGSPSYRVPGADDPVGVVLRVGIPPGLLDPVLITLMAADAGFHFSGEESLRLSEAFADLYMQTTDDLLGDTGRYNTPDTLRTGEGSAERTSVVAELDKLLSIRRLLDKDDRLINACVPRGGE